METSRDALIALTVIGTVFSIELAHSLWARGSFVTKRFFGFALAFFFLKGLVDVPRHVDETPFVMNFALLKHGRFNFGVHLLLMPLLRTSTAYAGFSLAAAALRWKRGGDVRFFRLNGFSMIAYCSLGSCIEGLNKVTHWWTWKMNVAQNAPGSEFVGFFFLWLVWGVGCFPSVLLNFLAVARPERMWRAGLAYLIGYWVLVIGISGVAPMLRNPVLFALAAFELGSALVAGGPRVVSLTKAPGSVRLRH